MLRRCHPLRRALGPASSHASFGGRCEAPAFARPGAEGCCTACAPCGAARRGARAPHMGHGRCWRRHSGSSDAAGVATAAPLTSATAWAFARGLAGCPGLFPAMQPLACGGGGTLPQPCSGRRSVLSCSRAVGRSTGCCCSERRAVRASVAGLARVNVSEVSERGEVEVWSRTWQAHASHSATATQKRWCLPEDGKSCSRYNVHLADATHAAARQSPAPHACED